MSLLSHGECHTTIGATAFLPVFGMDTGGSIALSPPGIFG